MALQIKKYFTLVFLFFYVTTTDANFFTFLWGKPVRNSIFYLPIGTHTRNGKRKLTYFQLMGGTYKTFYLMTFINSFGDRVFSAGVERYFWKFHRLSLGYGAGLMYGYQGKLSTVYGIPFKNSFLFKYNLNPVIVGIADFAITKRVQLSFVLAPLVVTGGIRFNFSD